MVSSSDAIIMVFQTSILFQFDQILNLCSISLFSIWQFPKKWLRNHMIINSISQFNFPQMLLTQLIIPQWITLFKNIQISRYPNGNGSFQDTDHTNRIHEKDLLSLISIYP